MNQEEFTIGESDFNLNFKKSHVNGCMDWGDLNPKAMLKLVEMKLMVLMVLVIGIKNVSIFLMKE